MSVEPFRVGLYPSRTDGGWRRIIAQELIPWIESEEPASPVTVFAGRLPDWLEAYVARGGVAVVSGADDTAGGLLPPPQPAAIHRFRPPGERCWAQAPSIVQLFAGPGWGEVLLHEDRKVKGGSDPDRFAVVRSERIGTGTVIFTGIPLTELLTAWGDSLRRFSPFTEVTERVASVDKAEVADTLVWMLRRAFERAGLPYARPARFPGAAPSVLILRVDVDGLFGDRARRLAEIAALNGVQASFFFNGSLSEEHPGDLDGWWRGHEVGHHGYVHNVFDDAEANRVNLERGASWIQQAIGEEARRFVAPRGLWNRALDTALVSLGYRYSSDFGLEFDSLPFRTPGGIWQVPVHPYSPERAHVFAEESGLPPPPPEAVRQHYLNVLTRQAERGRPVHVYGHPEVLGRMADDVVPALAEAARARGIPSLSLSAFVDWWERREASGFRAVVDRDRRSIEVQLDDAPMPIQVWGAERWVVNVSGREVAVPGGEAALVVT